MSWLLRRRLRSARGRRALRRPSQSDGLAAGPNQAAFDQVWELVRDRFYDPRLHGLDWQAMRARYRPEAASARNREETAVVINAMLAELGASHTHYYTPEDPAYYQLADIFAGALERRGLERVFPRGEVTYPGIGTFTQADDQGRIFITGVVEGAPAHQAGLLLGDEILSADGSPFRPVESFRGKVGVPVSLQHPPDLRRSAHGDQRDARGSPPERHVPARPASQRPRDRRRRQRPHWVRACLVVREPQDISPRSRT